MGEYIDWSAYSCDAACAGRVIQTSQEVAQSAREATASVGEATIVLESLERMVDDIQRNTEHTESQVIGLRNDITILIDEMNALKLSINDAVVPTIDNSILLMIISTLGAATICLVVCQALICYTSYLENKKNVRVQPKKRTVRIV